MRRRKRTNEDDAAYEVIDSASGGIMQLTDDPMTVAEQRKARALARQKAARPIGFVHPEDPESGGH